LKDGILTSAQLQWFASPFSNIRDLSLIDIVGLSNVGLSNFLQKVGSTLVKLSVIGSTIARDSLDEGYAIDLAMPIMMSLNTAHIYGDLLTTLAISGKERIPSHLNRAITIYRAPQIDDIDSFIDALGTTGWDDIEFASNNAMVWDDDAQRRVSEFAKDRGIRFHCFIDTEI
jgi:hypothetical protein